VQSVGTAQCITGVSRTLRTLNGDVHITAVEPDESPVLGGGAPGAHKIEGVGPGFVPPIWTNDLADEIVRVSTRDVKNMTRRLAREIVDNIPVMFAVLEMRPDMSQGQWLLVTLTAGVGGSMLSIGSAAGVAVMGQARGIYTFFAHLKWTWAIALGYAASILTHMWLNAAAFVI